MNWADFIPQLLATLVGAGVGVFGVVLAFRLQQRAAAADGVSRAADELLVRLADFVAQADAAAQELRLTNWMRGDRPQRSRPHAAPISIAVERLRIATAGDDRDVADAIARTWDVVAHPGDKGDQISAVGHMATAVAIWRLKEPRTRVDDSLETARYLAVGDIVVEPDRQE